MVANPRIVRNEQLLQRIADANIITEEGKNAIIQALDPMHDLPIDHLVGWPDMETAPSIVQCIKQTVQISNLLDANPFDLHFMAMPFVNAQKFTPVCPRLNSVIGTPATRGNFTATPLTILGGLTVFQTGVGQPCFLDTSPVVARLTLDDTFIHGPCRVVGMGYEVCNTTADLYKSGQVLCYRLPQPYNKPSGYQYYSPFSIPEASDTTGGAVVAPMFMPVTAQQFRPPVRDAAEMMLIAGTRQWKAEDGLYQVVPIVCGPDNPPLVGDYSQPIFPVRTSSEDQPDGDQSSPINNGNVIVPSVFTYPLPTETEAVDIGTLPCCRILPMQQCGSLFTGLNSQTTLTVTYNIFLETFPGPAEKVLLTLATPSCPFDPVALQCISRAFLNLPVGVPFADNGLGQAFAETLADMADVIAPIALAVGQPAIAAAVKGGGAIARGVSNYLAAPSPEEGTKAVKAYAATIKTKKKPPAARASATAPKARDVAAARQGPKKKRKRNKKGKKAVVYREGDRLPFQFR
jgi:hypothetical protein